MVEAKNVTIASAQRGPISGSLTYSREVTVRAQAETLCEVHIAVERLIAGVAGDGGGIEGERENVHRGRSAR